MKTWSVSSCNKSIHVKQESPVKQQLDCGVRYCDLRIAHRPNDSSTDLYFYHGVYTTVTVEVQHIKHLGQSCPKYGLRANFGPPLFLALQRVLASDEIIYLVYFDAVYEE